MYQDIVYLQLFLDHPNQCPIGQSQSMQQNRITEYVTRYLKAWRGGEGGECIPYFVFALSLSNYTTILNSIK